MIAVPRTFHSASSISASKQVPVTDQASPQQAVLARKGGSLPQVHSTRQRALVCSGLDSKKQPLHNVRLPLGTEPPLSRRQA